MSELLQRKLAGVEAHAATLRGRLERESRGEGRSCNMYGEGYACKMRVSELPEHTLINGPQLTFGDFFLFQIYHSLPSGQYGVGEPTLAIFTSYDVWDQALACYYLPWRPSKYSAQSYGAGPLNYREHEIKGFGEWNDYMVILDHWNHRPTFRELREAFRKAVKIEGKHHGLIL